MKLIHPEVRYGWLLVAFILFLTIERTLETFYSGKFGQNTNVKKDFLFIAVTVAYAVLAFIMIFEYFLVPRVPEWRLTATAFIFYFLAMSLRFGAVKTLGDSWQSVDKNRVLITDRGPFRYTRHPIYVGFAIEVITVPLITGTFLALLFSLFIFIPLIILKTWEEEKELLKLYGSQYEAYKKQRSVLIPF